MKQLLNLIFWFLTLCTLAISQDCSGGVLLYCNKGGDYTCACNPGWVSKDDTNIKLGTCVVSVGSGCGKGDNTTSSLAISQTSSDCNGGGVLVPCNNNDTSSWCACDPGYVPSGNTMMMLIDDCTIPVGSGCKMSNTTSS
jgi:hypothetical protein